jgi:SAM-dependent methyltransferase
VTATDLDRLRARLVCPLCKSALASAPDVLRCTRCQTRFPRTRSDCYELLPPSRAGDPGWGQRQAAMERWYRDMVTTDWAHACFDADYEPLRGVLAGYHGTVLDLGGGAGITRRYLGRDVRYVTLDPSLLWLDAEWTAFAEGPAVFVQGAGEALPFEADTFDVVLALWALNHVSDPALVLEEAGRVLVPGGRLLVVLEDMEPRWRDILARRYRPGGLARRGRDVAGKLRAAWPGGSWPLQPDHVRIREADLHRWTRAVFDVRRRAWVGDYLTWEYVKRVAGGA